MQELPSSGSRGPRWEYMIPWLYGPLTLVVVGLALLGFGSSGLAGTSISVTMLLIGFICLVIGVALPRVEGSFTAGPEGITAQMRPVDEVEKSFTATGPALAPAGEIVIEGETARVKVEAVPGKVEVAAPVPALGDVWDALEDAGFYPREAAGGTAFLQTPDGRSMSLPNRGFLDWRPVSEDLLAILRSWGVRPAASGKYHAPPHLPPDKATGPVSAKVTGPSDSEDQERS